MWVRRLQSPCIMVVKARVVTVLCRDRISQDYGATKESESSHPECLFPGQGQLFHTVSSASTSSSASVSVECGGWGECAGSCAAESTMIARMCRRRRREEEEEVEVEEDVSRCLLGSECMLVSVMSRERSTVRLIFQFVKGAVVLPHGICFLGRTRIQEDSYSRLISRDDAVQVSDRPLQFTRSNKFPHLRPQLAPFWSLAAYTCNPCSYSTGRLPLPQRGF